jgi:hypothetical protein
MKAPVLAVLLLAALGACRSTGETETPATPSPVSREVQLAPGESARVDGLTIAFEGVSADSRCPTDVTCIWEGDAVVVVRASEPSRDASALELHTAGRFPREATYGRYTVRLTALTPQPRESAPVPAEQYRATLQVVTQ